MHIPPPLQVPTTNKLQCNIPVLESTARRALPTCSTRGEGRCATGADQSNRECQARITVGACVCQAPGPCAFEAWQKYPRVCMWQLCLSGRAVDREQPGRAMALPVASEVATYEGACLLWALAGAVTEVLGASTVRTVVLVIRNDGRSSTAHGRACLARIAV